uniref:Uncharacterized protein n=1 Tax=Anguilla anguilla TaxID=7936 RepID=A0A0E9Q9T8_ANGAN
MGHSPENTGRTGFASTAFPSFSEICAVTY